LVQNFQEGLILIFVEGAKTYSTHQKITNSFFMHVLITSMT